MAKSACAGIGLVLFASGLVLAAECYTAFSFPPSNKASSDTLIMGAIPNREGRVSRSLMI